MSARSYDQDARGAPRDGDVVEVVPGNLKERVQVKGYDFTVFEAHNDWGLDVGKMQTELNQWGSKWVFQLEECPETKRLHFQGRLHLHKKLRARELAARCTFKAHWSVTSQSVHEGQKFNYVTKADTRVQGPWTDTEFETPPVLTRQLVTFKDKVKYPWQQQVEEWCGLEDDRSIKLIYDVQGNSGKSIMCEYLEYEKLAFEIPPLHQMEDIMQFCMSFKSQKVYLIDMPRAMKKDKLAGFYSGLECLKNGYVYDKRYAAKRRRFDRPQVVVFTNVLPAWEFMSKDRWEPYEMTEARALEPLEMSEGDSTESYVPE